MPRHFFLITNWEQEQRTAQEMLEHYRKRGTFEDRLGELSQAIAPRLSSPRFVENEVHLLVSLLAHNLVSILRGECERRSGRGWDLASVQRRALRVAVRITKAGRRLLVDVALPAVALWNGLLASMARWTRGSWSGQQGGHQRRKWIPPPRHAHLVTVLRE
jgi:hypothetical protein